MAKQSKEIGVTHDDPEHRNGSDAIDALQRTLGRRECEEPSRVRVHREASE